MMSRQADSFRLYFMHRHQTYVLNEDVSIPSLFTEGLQHLIMCDHTDFFNRSFESMVRVIFASFVSMSTLYGLQAVAQDRWRQIELAMFNWKANESKTNTKNRIVNMRSYRNEYSVLSFSSEFHNYVAFQSERDPCIHTSVSANITAQLNHI